MLSEKQRHSIIQENTKRLAVIRQQFDPITGVGSLVKRVKFKITQQNVVYIPHAMVEENLWLKLIIKHGSLMMYAKMLCEKNNVKDVDAVFNEAYASFIDTRLDHDFEYWAYVAAKITDKKSGLEIPFKLNLPQRRLVKLFEQQRVSGKPIRVIVCKARQWGGSTLTQIYMSWIQIRRKTGWGSLIVTEVEDQANNIRGMFDKLTENYPEYTAYDKNGDPIEHIKLVRWQNSSKIRKLFGRDCIVGVGSAQKPENTRGFDYAMCHMSEVGSWKATEGKSPEDLVQSIRGGVKKVAESMVVMESTAKGVGNFFHREWLAAKEGKGYEPFFMPWHGFADHLEDIPDSELDHFVRTMTDEDWTRWDQGATLQGIKWYNNHMRSENFDKWRMESEFPGDDIEAFQSTGSPVFHRRYTKALRDMCSDPVYKGQLMADTMIGKGVFNNMRFELTPEGRFWIWEMPDKSISVKRRYVVSVDIGGTTDKADWSVIRVIDRYWMKEGGNPKAVATWRGHIDQDILAWIAVQIAEFYNHALLVVESNSLKKKEMDQGADHFLTVLDIVAEVYDNIYARTTPEKIKEGAPVIYGWHTNKATKPLAINTLKSKVRDAIYEECDERLCDEMDSFMMHDNGDLGATQGMNDDIVMSTAIGLRVSDEMELPVEYNKADYKASKTGKKISANESTF